MNFNGQDAAGDIAVIKFNINAKFIAPGKFIRLDDSEAGLAEAQRTGRPILFQSDRHPGSRIRGPSDG